MPVGCFPSFRRKIKKFNKGKAPLSRKEEAKNDISQKTLKSTEANNHAEGKTEISTKVEHQAQVAQHQKEGKEAPNINKKNLEQVAEVHQSVEHAANELVTSSEFTEHVKEIDESYKCETASLEIKMVEHKEAEKTATTVEMRPKTELSVGHVEVSGIAISQGVEAACGAFPTEATVEQGEEFQCESLPPTEALTGFAKSQESTVFEAAEPSCGAPSTEITVEQGEEFQCESLPPTEALTGFAKSQESTVFEAAEPSCGAPSTEITVEQGEEFQCESLPPTEALTGFAKSQESPTSQEAKPFCGAVRSIMGQPEFEKFSGFLEHEFAQESIQNSGGMPTQVNESVHSINVRDERECVQNSNHFQASVLPEGFRWATLSSPLPEGAIDIHELHLPMHVGLVETEKGEIPCKYLKTKGFFYAGVDGKEEDFANGKVLCLDPNMAGSIEIEWVHVSTSDIRSRNLVAGARDACGKLLYIARGMIPLTGPYPYYELSSGWVSEDLEYAHLPYGGVEWKQRDFDVLAWKPKCC